MVFGLFAVAGLLLVGIVLILTTAGRIRPRRLSGAAGVLVAVLGAVLIVCGVALEILLATDTGALRATVGPLETRWSVAVWNPWFTLGGALFIWTAVSARRTTLRGVSSSQ